MRTLVAALVVAVATSACVSPKPKIVVPAEPPRPQVSLPSTIPVLKDRLVARCTAAGFIVIEGEDGSIMCGVTIEGPEAQSYLRRSGNPHAMPEQKVRFTLSQQGALVQVTADSWVELLGSTGEVRNEPLENPRRISQVNGLLNSLGRR